MKESFSGRIFLNILDHRQEGEGHGGFMRWLSFSFGQGVKIEGLVLPKQLQGKRKH